MLKKAILPLVILLAATALTVAIVSSTDPVEKIATEIPPPLVRVQTVRAAPLRLDVRSQGTVRPQTESNLVAEVSGAITYTSPSFEEGAFFRQGELLLRVDDRDYALAVESARAQVAQARVALVREEAEAEVASQEWKELGEGEASPLTLRVPQLQEAQARLAAAEAALEKSELDLSRTEIRAPFNGRVRTQRVDLGEFLNRGTPLGTVYSIDVAEVRLAVPDGDLAYLELPLDRATPSTGRRGPRVTLSADFAGERHSWEGHIVRTGGEIDPQSRMVTLIAQVEDPYRRRSGAAGVPLAVGLFVEADIEGREWDAVFEIPRGALRNGDTVLVVDPTDRIEFRTVGIVRSGTETVVVDQGLEDGDRVCLSYLDAPTSGMKVRTAEEPAPSVHAVEVTDLESTSDPESGLRPEGATP